MAFSTFHFEFNIKIAPGYLRKSLLLWEKDRMRGAVNSSVLSPHPSPLPKERVKDDHILHYITIHNFLTVVDNLNKF
jgi:hypothetical protein